MRYLAALLASITFLSPLSGQVPALHFFSGDATDDELGRAVSGAGDVNGDGFDDLIVGVPFDDDNGVSAGIARVYSGEDGSVLYTLKGDSPNDWFGWSVSGAGDINGDGFDDLIVGTPHDDFAGFNAGSATIFSGITGLPLYTFDGDSAGDSFGTSVSGAGDVNGDGFADIIVGAPEDDNNGMSSGSARVFSGADYSVLHTFNGDGSFEEFGGAVSDAGDVNGDGFGDVIVGASKDDFAGSNAGSAWVYSGVNGSLLFVRDGDSADDFFGTSVSGAGDVNGDDFDDVIVGAPGDDNRGSLSGSARLFSGIDGTVLHTFYGDAANDTFGASVSGAGDVNGDGFDDVIVGSNSNDTLANNAGSAQVFAGFFFGSLLYRFHGTAAEDRFGQSVSGAGDVNGDGFSDVIVGAHLDDGGLTRINAGKAFVFASVAPAPRGDSRDYGVGCLTSDGHLPQIDLTGRPIIGQPIDVLLRAGPAFDTVGILPRGTGTAGLFLDLIGMPGCQLLLNGPLFVHGSHPVNVMGQASAGLVVPNDSSLINAKVYFQWAILDGPVMPLANTLGLVASEGLEVTIGAF